MTLDGDSNDKGDVKSSMKNEDKIWNHRDHRGILCVLYG